MPINRSVGMSGVGSSSRVSSRSAFGGGSMGSDRDDNRRVIGPREERELIENDWDLEDKEVKRARERDKDAGDSSRAFQQERKAKIEKAVSDAAPAFRALPANMAGRTFAHGRTESGAYAPYTARDRSFTDKMNPVPGVYSNAFDAWNPETGQWEKRGGFSTGAALGAGAGLLAGVPGLGVLGGMADPPTPNGLETDSDLPSWVPETMFSDARLVPGGGGAFGDLFSGGGDPTRLAERNAEYKARRDDNQQRAERAATEPVTKTEDPAEPPDTDEPDDPLDAWERQLQANFTNFKGDWLTYAQPGGTSEHVFFQRG